MSFNQNTKINNLYQLINTINVDTSGNTLAIAQLQTDVSQNTLDIAQLQADISGGSLPTATEFGQYLYYDTSGNEWTTGGGTSNNYNVRIGRLAGYNTKGSSIVCLGNGAGYDSSNNVIALGNLAGSESATNCISIGSGSAVVSKQEGSISIGANSAYFNQGQNSVAIGVGASQNYAKEKSISCGYLAGRNYIGIGSICVGANTESTNFDGSIVISGGTTGLSATANNALYISPIRNSANNDVLLYNSVSKEITYNSTVPSATSASTVNITNDVGDSTCFPVFVNATASGTAQALKGNSALTYNAVSSILGVGSVKTSLILDNVNSSGGAGQYLTSNGSAILWKSNPYAYAFSTTTFTPASSGVAQIFPLATSGTLSLSNEFFTNLTGNRLKYSGAATRKFKITASLQGGLCNSSIYALGFEVRKNGVLVPGSAVSQYSFFYVSTGIVNPPMTSNSIVEMVTNDEITIYCVCSDVTRFPSGAFAGYTPTGLNTVPSCVISIEAI